MSTHREDFDLVMEEMRNRENYNNVMDEIALYYNAALREVRYYYSELHSGDSVWFWWFYNRMYESESELESPVGDPDRAYWP